MSKIPFETGTMTDAEQITAQDESDWFWWEAESGNHCYSHSGWHGIVDNDGLAPAVVWRESDRTYSAVVWFGPEKHERARGGGEETTGFASLSDAKKFVEVMVRLEREP
jgi:hypothetical protein